MAMDGDELGQKIAEAVMNAAAPPDIQAEVIKVWQKIGGAIVVYIQEKAEVPAGIALQAGPYPGSTNAPGTVK